MSQLIRTGYLYYISEKFDDNFRQLASPIKISFAAGFVAGAVVVGGVGCLLYLYQRSSKTVNRVIRGERQELIAGDDGIQPINGVFEESQNEIFNVLENLLSIDGRLNRLSAFFEQPEVNTLVNLMSNVTNASRGRMPQNNEALNITYFFARVTRFLRNVRGIEENARVDFNSRVRGLTRLCFEKDILLMYTNDDLEFADQIEEMMEQMNITVDLQGEVGIGQSVFSVLENGFRNYMFIFVIITQNRQNDGVQSFLAQGQLLNSLVNNHNRLIPVRIAGDNFASPVFGQLNPWVYGTDRSRRTLTTIMQNCTDIVFNL